jgi:hypothetical protein
MAGNPVPTSMAATNLSSSLAIEEPSNRTSPSMTDYKCLHEAHRMIDYHQMTDIAVDRFVFEEFDLSFSMINQSE